MAKISIHVSRSALVFRDNPAPKSNAVPLVDFGVDFEPGPGFSIGNHSAVRVGPSEDGSPQKMVLFQFSGGDKEGPPDFVTDFLDLI